MSAVEGNLLDVSSVRRAFEGVDAVFLLNAVAQTEASEGLMALTQMRRAGVKRVVYNSVHKAESAAYLPHFGSSLALKRPSSARASLTPSCGRTTSIRTTTGSRTSSCSTGFIRSP
jgi:hypothetical protein